MVTLRAELKPLLVSLMPVILVATWAFTRLAWVPPTPGQPITVQAYFPVLATGEMAHIVPRDGLDAPDGFIRRVVEDTDADGNAANGIASWSIRLEQRDRPYELEFRHRGLTVCKKILVDGVRYSAPVETYDNPDIQAVQLVLAPYKLFSVVPGIEQLLLPPWLAAYFVLAIPSVLVLKRVFGVY